MQTITCNVLAGSVGTNVVYRSILNTSYGVAVTLCEGHCYAAIVHGEIDGTSQLEILTGLGDAPAAIMSWYLSATVLLETAFANIEVSTDVLTEHLITNGGFIRYRNSNGRN